MELWKSEFISVDGKHTSISFFSKTGRFTLVGVQGVTAGGARGLVM